MWNYRANGNIYENIPKNIYDLNRKDRTMKVIKNMAVLMIFIAAAAIFSSCSGYVMTDEDIALQNSMVGYWAAEGSTGYNTYDENGTLQTMIVVKFSDDFSYQLFECNMTEGYTTAYDPIEYKIEKGKFRVDVKGVASFAGVNVSEDGKTLYWVTDQKTDQYTRMDEATAEALGILSYDETAGSSTEAASENSDTETVTEE